MCDSILCIMASLRGECFHVDLSSDEEDIPQGYRRPKQPPITPNLGFVKDIIEKSTSATARPPQAPTGASTSNGFPAHKKRTGLSKFKQQRNGISTSRDSTATSHDAQPSAASGGESFEARERREIDQENNRRLAEMSSEEIEQERRELINGMNASLIERLLKRANMDEDRQPQDFPGIENAAETQSDLHNVPPSTPKPVSTKRVAFAQPDDDDEMPDVLDGREGDTNDDGSHIREQDEGEGEGEEAGSHTHDHSEGRPPVHFPRPTTNAPDLDPNSDTFLTDLHEKYFPDMPSDPSKLAWMSDPGTSPSAYSLSNPDLPITALRFSFIGTLVSPTQANQIAVTKGLHHHGESPSAAGYTIGELAHLARSSFPAQRSMAFQTLGRFLYRLGKGEFTVGEEGEAIERGLWACVRQGRVLDTLKEEAERKGGHMSAKAYAIDALWLWRMGGGKEPIELGAN